MSEELEINQSGPLFFAPKRNESEEEKAAREEQYLKDLEKTWEAYFAIEFGMSRDEFFDRLNTIQRMVNEQAPLQELLDQIYTLQILMRRKSITSNPTDMTSE